MNYDTKNLIKLENGKEIDEKPEICKPNDNYIDNIVAEDAIKSILCDLDENGLPLINQKLFRMISSNGCDS